LEDDSSKYTKNSLASLSSSSQMGCICVLYVFMYYVLCVACIMYYALCLLENEKCIFFHFFCIVFHILDFAFVLLCCYLRMLGTSSSTVKSSDGCEST
jgi:hypothetical protein